MTSLVCGIIATVLGAIMFPIALSVHTTGAFAFLGFLGITALIAAFVGIVTSASKLLTTDKTGEENISNRSIAWKGFWFSVSPLSFWLFLAMIAAFNK